MIIIVGMIPSIVIMEGCSYFYRKDSVEEKLNNLSAQANILAYQLNEEYLKVPYDQAIDEEISSVSSALNTRVMIIDSDYKVVKDTYLLDNGKYMVSPIVINSINNKSTQTYDQKQKYMEVTSIIKSEDGDRLVGLVILYASTEDLESLVHSLNSKILLVEVICFIVLIVVSFYLSWILTRPFTKMTSSIDEMSDGFFTEDIEFKSYLETEQMAMAFNKMLSKMRSLDESRQEFVSNVSHELKTPITSMKVLADSLLVQEDVPIETYKEFMSDIADEIERENKIITDLLALVKLDKSSSDLNIAPVIINDLIELILKRLRPIAAKRNIELVFESFRPVTAEVDDVKLTLAISNLVENAIKYNVDNGYVHVSLNADHQYFYVKVSDSGIGIPEESIDHIYERFYRVDKSHSRQIGGTGLGLSITRNAVLMHRGAIKVYSRENEGTTFNVRIPILYQIEAGGKV
ncbi:sensor histidine kinase [Acetitomaculum ruminis]|uniref:sensor histidine kinase n=1 Tax=Acetitomaculum ruminis TaxID=2382 RepID=UPI000A912964|nr:HAMP domain-containing sensor histidine kinase [Acetitomaculum ruminis]